MWYWLAGIAATAIVAFYAGWLVSSLTFIVAGDPLTDD